MIDMRDYGNRSGKRLEGEGWSQKCVCVMNFLCFYFDHYSFFRFIIIHIQ